MLSKSKKTIHELFEEGTPIDRAIAHGVRDALLFHKRIGNPIAVWRDGGVVLVPADQIEIPVIDDDDTPSQ